jgi:hypothetical protein
MALFEPGKPCIVGEPSMNSCKRKGLAGFLRSVNLAKPERNTLRISMSIVSVQDAKGWLRFPNPSQAHPDDNLISELIDAAQAIIERWCGAVVPRPVNETYDGNERAGYQGRGDPRSVLFLRWTPVVSISAITESYGSYAAQLDDVTGNTGVLINGTGGAVATSPYGYSLDNAETGQVTRRGVGFTPVPWAAGVENISIQYTAGRESVPPVLTLAALELVAHTYQGALQRGVSVGGVNVMFDAELGMNVHNPSDGSQLWVGIPARVLQLLESERQAPFIA